MRLHREKVRLHYIAHVHEVARLFSIFEYHRAFAIQQTGREDSAHTGIRIRERLPGTINVEIAQSYRWYAVRSTHDKTELLLVLFGNCIDGSRKERLIFTRRKREQGFPASIAFQLPTTIEQLGRRAQLR